MAAVAVGPPIGHVGVDQDSDRFVPRRNLFVRWQIASLPFVQLLDGVPQVVVRFFIVRPRCPLRRPPLSGWPLQPLAFILLRLIWSAVRLRFVTAAPASPAVAPRTAASLAFLAGRPLTAGWISLRFLCPLPIGATLGGPVLHLLLFTQLTFHVQVGFTTQIEIGFFARRFDFGFMPLGSRFPLFSSAPTTSPAATAARAMRLAIPFLFTA